VSQSKQISFSFARFRWALPLILLAATFLAYYPAWHGQPIWDDDAHMTKPELRSWQGLIRIWTEIGATQQYYPLAHSAFWVQQKFWGDSTLGYHLVNILLHAISALLLLKILWRLEIPGAMLAAAIFALHPVHVESVAWITELKNTLSGVFYLGSALACLEFDRTRSKRICLLALGLFVLSLMAKTAVATLPMAMLVIFWWKRGKLSWRQDVWPLLPFFLAALASGLVTVWGEQKIWGAKGSEFDFTLIERCLIAGRSVCFHAGKLFWPAKLSFMYSHWQINASVWWQYIYPAAVLLLLAVLWILRRWNRGPLAALLFFIGTLFPALGFFNAYSFRYSFVNDHHQYLASLGLITLVSAGVALLLTHWGFWRRPLGNTFVLALLVALASLTWRQCLIYSDLETLWRDTLVKNPGSWQAHDQLGCLFDRQGKNAQAAYQFSIMTKMHPQEAGGYFNWGLTLQKMGRIDEAISKFETALQRDPKHFEAHCVLAEIFTSRRQWDQTISHYLLALKIHPEDRTSRFRLVSALTEKGRLDEAIGQMQQLIRDQPQDSLAHLQLAIAFLRNKRANNCSAELLEAIRCDPKFVEQQRDLYNLLNQQTNFFSALDLWRKALDIRFQSAELFNNFAWILATHPDAAIRNGPQAVQFAERACQLNGAAAFPLLDTLAASYAEAGRFDDAIKTQQKAIGLADQSGAEESAAKLRQRLQLYQARQPYRQP